MTGSPTSCEIDGRRFILTPADRVLYAWALPTHHQVTDDRLESIQHWAAALI